MLDFHIVDKLRFTSGFISSSTIKKSIINFACSSANYNHASEKKTEYSSFNGNTVFTPFYGMFKNRAAKS